MGEKPSARTLIHLTKKYWLQILNFCHINRRDVNNKKVNDSLLKHLYNIYSIVYIFRFMLGRCQIETLYDIRNAIKVHPTRGQHQTWPLRLHELDALIIIMQHLTVTDTDLMFCEYFTSTIIIGTLTGRQTTGVT